jgi:SAM-dependent methyltransferase
MTAWSWEGRRSRAVLAYIPFVCCFALLASAQIPHQHHPPLSADEYAKILEDPSRDEWQKPHEVVMALKIEPIDVVADIGSGTGYFARRFALHAAKVYAIDIDPKLLEISARSAPPNLLTVLAQPGDPMLAPSSVDLILFCDVLHHLDSRPLYLRHLQTVLKPGGRIVAIDFHKKPLPLGPPEAMKLSEDSVIAEFQEAGFPLSRKETFLPHH